MHTSKSILLVKTLEKPSSIRFPLQEPTLAEIFTARRLARQVPIEGLMRMHTLELGMEPEIVNIYGYYILAIDVIFWELMVINSWLWLLLMSKLSIND